MGFLKDFKTKECKNSFCKFIQYVTFNTYAKMILSALIVFIIAITFNFTIPGTFLDDMLSYINLVALITLASIAVLLIIYAWFINPIKRLIKKFRNKND